MKMTHTQRLILSNQYAIMALLDPLQKAKYTRLKHIVEQGYELQIREIDNDFSHLPETVCQSVIRAMEMHHALQESYEQLVIDEQNLLSPQRLQFHGFDSKTEMPLVKYTRFLIEIENQFPTFQQTDHQFDTQLAMLEKYKRMLILWEKCPRQYHLSLTEIQQILEA
jgi:hypothetical protein